MSIKKVKLQFLGKNNVIILESNLTNLPLKEEYIIQRSLELYNDCNPCMIHRSAIINATYLEIYEFLEHAATHEIVWDQIPESLRQCLNIDEEDMMVLVLH